MVSGFWHGANWTFVIWGLLNAIYFLPLLLRKKNRKNVNNIAEGKFLPSGKEFIQILSTFLLTTLAWVFFRAESFTHAVDYIYRITTTSFSIEAVHELIQFMSKTQHLIPVLFICLLLTFEWINRDKQYGLSFGFLDRSNRLNSLFKYSLYTVLIVFIIAEYPNVAQSFIYFQF